MLGIACKYPLRWLTLLTAVAITIAGVTAFSATSSEATTVEECSDNPLSYVSHLDGQMPNGNYMPLDEHYGPFGNGLTGLQLSQFGTVCVGTYHLTATVQAFARVATELECSIEIHDQGRKRVLRTGATTVTNYIPESEADEQPMQVQVSAVVELTAPVHQYSSGPRPATLDGPWVACNSSEAGTLVRWADLVAERIDPVEGFQHKPGAQGTTLGVPVAGWGYE